MIPFFTCNKKKKCLHLPSFLCSDSLDLYSASEIVRGTFHDDSKAFMFHSLLLKKKKGGKKDTIQRIKSLKSFLSVNLRIITVFPYV